MRTLSAILLLAVPLVAAAEASEPVALAPDQITAFGIETVPARGVDAATSRNFPAEVQVPNAQLRVVGAPLEGMVEALLVAEGEPVAEGQALARIRSARMLELQAAFLEARTRRRLAEKNVRRDRMLHEEGIVAERRLLESEARYRELRAGEARDRQVLGLAGMTEDAIRALARSESLSAVLEVRAPLAGVVLEQIATAGQRLAPADPLYRIGALSPLWVEVHVPLESLGDTAPGSRLELPRQGIEGRVITVGRMIHGADQGVLVRAEITAGTQALRPGQFVEARLLQDMGANAVRVPVQALVQRAGTDHVFVRRGDAFAPVPVEVVSRGERDAVVRGALAPEDAVVARGTAALKAAWAGGAE